MSVSRPGFQFGLLFLLAGLIFWGGNRSEASPEIATLTVTPVSVDFPIVTLRLKVPSPKPLSLEPSQVRLTDNNLAVAEASVSGSTARQWLVLLLDRSSSLENVIAEVRKSAKTFVAALPQDLRIAVITFASDIDINQDFTQNRRDLEKSIDSIRSWGGTVLYDASFLACEQLYYQSDPRDLRTLVLFTDGRDETPVGRRRMSTRTFEEVLTLAERKKIRIVTVGLGDEIDENILKGMASSTGGFYLHAPNPKELYGVYRQISQRMRQERHFTVSFVSPQPMKDGGPHHVKLELQLPWGLETTVTHFDAPLDPRVARLRARKETLDISMPEFPAPAPVSALASASPAVAGSVAAPLSAANGSVVTPLPPVTASPAPFLPGILERSLRGTAETTTGTASAGTAILTPVK
jgi:VWFA-related protein